MLDFLSQDQFGEENISCDEEDEDDLLKPSSFLTEPIFLWKIVMIYTFPHHCQSILVLSYLINKVERDREEKQPSVGQPK
jgi:hypothetical protein